jgi:methyl-accepting chemotaxis protein-1 (serine sensor receptor)
LRSASLQFKSLLLMGAALSIALCVGVLAVSRVYASIEELDRIGREDFQSQLAIAHAKAALKAQAQAWRTVLLRGSDAETTDKLWADFTAQEKELQATVKEARAGLRDKDAIAKLNAFLDAHKAAGEKYRQALEAFRAARFDPHAGEAIAGDADAAPFALLGDAENLAVDEGARATAQAVASAERGYRIAIAGTVLAMAAALAVLWVFIRRAVIEPIGEAVRFAGAIEQGDLTRGIDSRSRDEIGALTESLGAMQASLKRVVFQVRASSDAVVGAAHEVAACNNDISQRTEDQASSLEETAASMEQLASTVKQNADNAAQADKLARGASTRSEQGGTEVGRVVATMTDISGSARRIKDIIAVIDAIAFQTNILALNAAVEAARAGEQGRGFAVVAAEVRTLAQRSAEAARQIKDLIGTTVDSVENGTGLVAQAGATIDELVADVRSVSSLMESIAEASAEQSRGVQQVNRTVTEMDRAVQQNAHVMQRSVDAAGRLRREAQSLADAVSAFRLPAEGGARPSGVPVAVREPELLPSPVR